MSLSVGHNCTTSGKFPVLNALLPLQTLLPSGELHHNPMEALWQSTSTRPKLDTLPALCPLIAKKVGSPLWWIDMWHWAHVWPAILHLTTLPKCGDVRLADLAISGQTSNSVLFRSLPWLHNVWDYYHIKAWQKKRSSSLKDEETMLSLVPWLWVDVQVTSFDNWQSWLLMHLLHKIFCTLRLVLKRNSESKGLLGAGQLVAVRVNGAEAPGPARAPGPSRTSGGTPPPPPSSFPVYLPKLTCF